MIQAFRRFQSHESSRTLRLKGLDPAARYTVTDLDGKLSTQATGAELMEQGLAVTIEDQPGAVIITYVES